MSEALQCNAHKHHRACNLLKNLYYMFLKVLEEQEDFTRHREIQVPNCLSNCPVVKTNVVSSPVQGGK
eukprot:4654529-Amphidinium_carterae.1